LKVRNDPTSNSGNSMKDYDYRVPVIGDDEERYGINFIRKYDSRWSDKYSGLYKRNQVKPGQVN